MRDIFLLYFILRSNVRFVLFLMSLADIQAVKSLCVRSICDCLDMQIFRSMLSNSNFPGRNRTLQSIVAIFFMMLSINVVIAAGNSVSYKIDGQDFEGYYVAAAKNAPLVLLVHDWDGLTGYEIKRANMLADMGYSVFAADLFGAGVRPTKVSDKRQHTGALYKDRNKMRSLLNGALDAAQSQGANINNAVAMGYCFGGAAVLELARSGAALKGFATFHGGLGTPKGQNYSNTKGKLLVMHGSADKNITMDDFANLTKQLEKVNVPHEMITYSGAPHAFTVFDSPAYTVSADKESWKRFSQFLSDTLDNSR